MAKARRFTGWHMTAILVSFFLIVIIVNLVMARAAIGTFGGTVVENSYVAGQKFDDWAKAAADQKKLGWVVKGALAADRKLRVAVTDAAGSAAGFTATASAHHPLGRLPEQTLSFAPSAGGQLVSTQSLPAGRWQVKLSVSRNGKTFRQLLAVQ